MNYRRRITDKIEGLHESSYLWARLDFDYEVSNNLTIEDLRVKAMCLTDEILSNL